MTQQVTPRQPCCSQKPDTVRSVRPSEVNVTTAHQHALTMLGKSKGELSWMHHDDMSFARIASLSPLSSTGHERGIHRDCKCHCTPWSTSHQLKASTRSDQSWGTARYTVSSVALNSSRRGQLSLHGTAHGLHAEEADHC